MPYIVLGDERSKGKATNFGSMDLGYEYPDGIDLKPGSDQHEAIKNAIWQRARESRNVIQKRFDSWNKVDETLTTFMPVTEKEDAIKLKDSRKPISVVFPYSYAMLETLLTYVSMAFFQDPMFRYEGHSPEDTKGAILMELVIQLHCIKSKVALNLHTMFRDAFAYGLGVVAPSWDKLWGKKAIKRESTLLDAAGMPLSDEFREFRDAIIFEGNKLENIDPYMFLPDPNVAIQDVQKGEYVGWIIRDNIMNKLSEEQNDPENVFNVKYLQKVINKRSSLSIDQSDREKKYGGPNNTNKELSGSTTALDEIFMYVNLIPSQFPNDRHPIGDSDYPEKWAFVLSSDEVITSMQKVEQAHGLYPVAVIAPEFDGYSPTPISRIEVLYGLQGVLDWLFNSHIANVRKSLNDMFVVDPYLVNINDLKDPGPGKLIRLRRPAWGRGVDKVVQQLAVNDVTRQNIGDTAYITNWMDKIAGTDASMMGALRQGGPERLTKGEFQGTRGGAVGRMQRLAMIIGLQGMQDIGNMFASHTQQYMSQDVYVKTIGRYKEDFDRLLGVNPDKMKVSPYDLLVNYDLIVRDGSVPGGNFSEIWVEMFNIISSSPELMQQFEVTKIFTYMAKQLGAKNVEDFIRTTDQVNMTTMPDDEVMRQAQAGNLVPTGV
jgi:hypothetical protein